MKTNTSLITLLLLLTTTACKKSPTIDPPIDLHLQSPSFHQGDTISRQFTCDGPNISPALSWSAPPAHTQSLAVILSDPDAPSGTFTHWVLYNLPPQTHSFREAIPTQPQLPDGSQQGQNDNDSTGYWGPCPPARHRYFFVVFALDTRLTLPSNADSKQFYSASRGHLVGASRLIGFYQR